MMPPTMSSADAMKARRRRGWYCHSWTGMSEGDDDVFYEEWWNENRHQRQMRSQQQHQQVMCFWDDNNLMHYCFPFQIVNAHPFFL